MFKLRNKAALQILNHWRNRFSTFRAGICGGLENGISLILTILGVDAFLQSMNFIRNSVTSEADKNPFNKLIIFSSSQKANPQFIYFGPKSPSCFCQALLTFNCRSKRFFRWRIKASYSDVLNPQHQQLKMFEPPNVLVVTFTRKTLGSI